MFQTATVSFLPLHKQALDRRQRKGQEGKGSAGTAWRPGAVPSRSSRLRLVATQAAGRGGGQSVHLGKVLCLSQNRDSIKAVHKRKSTIYAFPAWQLMAVCLRRGALAQLLP